MWRRKLVRLHLRDDLPSLEGLLLAGGTGLRDGHYALELPKLIEGTDQTVSLEGRRVLVPRERVAFVQEIK